MTGEVLSDRALNRATLARQGLLAREDATPIELIERFVGVQAQEPVVPYVTLWSRLNAFVPDDLQSLLKSGAVLRVPLWRNTVHIVTREDFLRFWATSRRSSNYTIPRVKGVSVAAAARSHLPATLPELGRALGAQFPDHDPFYLSHLARAELPLVHLPPAGFWRRAGVVQNGVLDGCQTEHADEDLIRRYLRGFGPASVKDAQYFAGVTRLKPAFDALRGELVTFRDERGAELFDLPDAPRPPAGTPAPVRFLGVFDNALIGYADRARILAPHYDKRIVGPEAPILIDGFAAATWIVKAGTMSIAGDLPAAGLAEARRLADFLEVSL